MFPLLHLESKVLDRDLVNVTFKLVLKNKHGSFPEILSKLKFLKAHQSQSCMVCLSVVRTSPQDAIAPKSMPVKFSYHRSNLSYSHHDS